MQISFFDESARLKKIEKLGDILVLLDAIVNWHIFTSVLDKSIVRQKSEKGGRPPYDNLLMFKILVIKRLFNLSLDQTEYQINDRLSFMRFLGLGLGDRVPDAKTIWLYEEMLSKNEAGKRFLTCFLKQSRIKDTSPVPAQSLTPPLFTPPNERTRKNKESL